MNDEKAMTLHDYLVSEGRDVLESYTCPVSGEVGPAWSFVYNNNAEPFAYEYIAASVWLEHKAKLAREEAEAMQNHDREDWLYIRSVRDNLLMKSDWTQGADAARRGLDLEKIAEWAEYRQALADLPSRFDSPAEVVWPIPPK